MIVVMFQNNIYTGFASVEQAEAMLKSLGFYKPSQDAKHWANSGLDELHWRDTFATIIETQGDEHLGGHVREQQSQSLAIKNKRPPREPLPDRARTCSY